MNEFREASLQQWSTVAPDWGELIQRTDRQLGRAADWMIEAAGLQPGERVLELAGGPGTLSMQAARAVGDQGKVICTDFAESMVEVARNRLTSEGIGNVEFRVMDAEALDLPDGAVDVVLCRMGYMLMADPATALRESGRVLASGGRLALAVWSGPDANPWAAILMRAIMEHIGAPPPPPDGPGLWALADQDKLRGLLTDAGLSSVHTELVEDQVEFKSPEEWLGVTGRLAAPVRAVVNSLDDQARGAIIARVGADAAPYRRQDDTLAIPERMIVASARRD